MHGYVRWRPARSPNHRRVPAPLGEEKHVTAGRRVHDVQRTGAVPGRAGCTVDAVAALSERLTRLGDGALMRTLLQQALDDLWPRYFTVEDYAIDHCKVTPWREISVALSLTLRSTRTGDRSRQIVAGTVFATVDEARRHLQRSRAVCDTAAASALVPELAMVMCPFPFDSGLPGLAHATDTRAMTALLAAHLPEWTWRRPDGGLSLWPRLPYGDADALAQLALRQGVAIVPGPTCTPDGGQRDRVRLPIVRDPATMRAAIERLAVAWRMLDEPRRLETARVVV
jgi:hypothetical protein